jgi:hypothetical protein
MTGAMRSQPGSSMGPAAPSTSSGPATGATAYGSDASGTTGAVNQSGAPATAPTPRASGRDASTAPGDRR